MNRRTLLRVLATLPVVGLPSLAEGAGPRDLLRECRTSRPNEGWARLDAEEFEDTFCRYCKNDECSRATGRPQGSLSVSRI